MNSSTTRTAIVTGASRGIGSAIAHRLANDGFAVIVNYAGSQPEAEQLVRQIESEGGRAAAIQADVSDPAAVTRLFAETEALFGGVDILVNNAGIMHNATIAEMDDVPLDRMIAVNLKGTFYTLREAAKRLRSGGRIISLSTSVLGMALPSYSVYAATKAGVEAFTAILAKELRGKNITVNAVAPGPTATDLFFRDKSDEQVAHLARMAPLERIGEPAEIASTVSFLVGPDGAWVNGQTLRVNGGLV